jgi:hypothetical protein
MARFGVRSGSLAFARLTGSPAIEAFHRTGANGRERTLSIAMQKVEGSSPFIRSKKSCKYAGRVACSENSLCKMARFWPEAWSRVFRSACSTARANSSQLPTSSLRKRCAGDRACPGASVGARLERPDQGGQLVEVGAREPVAVAAADRRGADEAGLSEFLEVVGDE